MLTLQEKRNRKSREYITKLGFDQHPDLNRAGTSCVTAHLESQLGKGPRQRVCSVGEASKTAGQGSCLSSQDGGRLMSPSICDQVATLLMWMLCVLSWKTWNVARGLVGQTPPGSQQSQDSFPILSKVFQVLHSEQAVTPSHSQSGQCPGRLEARSEACSGLSLKPK